MAIRKQISGITPVTLAVMLAACGGGSGDSGNPAASTEAGQEIAEASPVTISGRVADGYIRGATVCIDLNENSACDADEPSATTREGGIYDLPVPAGSEDKPIVAAIPAGAIDEDTGEAVGQPLVFIAPPEKPEFVSPMTTLVHHELKANPALDVAQAEQAVKSDIGIDEADISLFDDYVAESNDESSDAERLERFRYMHDTARVVASMMKDIESQVEDAVSSNGVDVVGDSATQQAIRDIVRSEIRELLPEIALQVAEIVESTSAVGEQQGSTAERPEFNPEEIAVALRPMDTDENILDRIDAVIERVEVSETTMERVFTEGVYWLEFDCDHGYYPEDHTEVSTDAQHDPAIGETADVVRYLNEPDCDARYGFAQLDDSGNSIVTENYVLDSDSGSWMVEMGDEYNDYPSDYALIEGQWAMVESQGPEGLVEFAEDGSAVIVNEAGVMRLKAVTLPLDATPVINHLWEVGAEPLLLDITEPGDLFSAGAVAHKVSVDQSFHPYVLFNHASQDHDGQQCSQFNGNCNVVDIFYQQQAYSPNSIDEVREMSLNGVELITHGGFGPDTVMRLEADNPEAGGLPDQGVVKWFMGHPGEEHAVMVEPEGQVVDAYDTTLDYGTHSVDQGPAHGCELIVGPDGLPVDVDTAGEYLPEPQYGVDTGSDVVGPDGVLYPESVEGHHNSEGLGDSASEFEPTVEYPAATSAELTGPEGMPVEVRPAYPDCVDPAVYSGESLQAQPGSPDGQHESAVNGDTSGQYPPIDSHQMPEMTSEWRLVQVQGQTMLEISLPLQMRHDGMDSGEAMLLIEHEGFIRAGARLSDSYIDQVTTYNENAFTLLKSIVERKALQP